MRTAGVSAGDGVDWGAGNVRVSAVLPPAEAPKESCYQDTTPAHGRDAAPDHCAGVHEAAGFADAGTNVCGLDDAWQQLLAQLRGASDFVAGEPVEAVVGTQLEDGILLAQEHSAPDPQVGTVRSATKTLWVINTEDWVDVEYVLRKLMRCESTDCHAFHSIGYVYFRSCAVSHVVSPSDFLKAGMVYKFPETEVVIEIVQAAPEGVVEVACFLEYVP